MGWIIGLAIVIVLFILIISNIYVVQQSRAYVVERLGAFHAVQGVGLHFKVPFIDRIARRVSLREQVLDYPPQPAVTPTLTAMTSTRVTIWLSMRRLCSVPAGTSRSC